MENIENKLYHGVLENPNWLVDEQRLLFSITLLDGEDRESYAIISENLDKACTLALEQHIRERNGSKEQQDHVPSVDMESSYEISCASDRDGKLYTIDLQPYKE